MSFLNPDEAAFSIGLGSIDCKAVRTGLSSSVGAHRLCFSPSLNSRFRSCCGGGLLDRSGGGCGCGFDCREVRLSLCLETLGSDVVVPSLDGGACWLELLVGIADDEALLVGSAVLVGANWFRVGPSLESTFRSCSGGGLLVNSAALATGSFGLDCCSYGVLDCRLTLCLDTFGCDDAAVLSDDGRRSYGVFEIRLSLCLVTVACDVAFLPSPDGGIGRPGLFIGSADDEALLVESAAPVDTCWCRISSSLGLGIGSCPGGNPPGKGDGLTVGSCGFD